MKYGNRIKYKKKIVSSITLGALLLVGYSSSIYSQQVNSTGVSNNTLQLTPANSDSANTLNQRSPNPDLLFPQPNYLQRQAFQSVSRKAMPMTPAEVHQFKQMLAATEQAAAASPTTPPKPVTSSMMVSLAPGATPPVINLQKGFISSLVFVDASGNKWPIKSYDLGNPNAFNVQWQQGTNTLLIQANSMYTYANLAVTLKGTSTPVMLTLIPGQTTVDYRVDLHVQGQSPDAPPPIQGDEPGQASNTLLNVLNGTPPTGAQALQLSGAQCSADLNNCQGWIYKGKLYLRIPNVILSPSWVSTMQSSDGVHAYYMEKTPSILVSVNGQPEAIQIEGYS